MQKFNLFIAAMLLFIPASAFSMERIAPPEGAEVYFIAPSDGETIEGPVTVKMGLRGMGVAPAGVDIARTGHHHLLVNLPLEEVDLGASLPFSDQTRHFGGGQTEAVLDLPSGTHTLQLLFMDYRHISFDPAVVSDRITITVR